MNQVPHLPSNITQAVNVYRALATDYAATTDPVVKEAYKKVLDFKYSQITANISSYTSNVQNFISSIQVT